MATGIPGVTSANAAHTAQTTLYRAIFLDRPDEILRTRRRKTTVSTEQRAYEELVRSRAAHQQKRWQFAE